ncbi:MAG: SufE family protein [Bacteroidales bacterium]|nr:SufE family protein [Bacteroidales bacterium]MBR7004452.1 SufE family protein [Bacteroidales bacterium]
MKTLEEAKQAVIDDFSMYDEWLDKYEYLIELGKNLEEYPEESKTEDKLIKGCQSRVWLDSKVEDGKIWFKADSDAIITKGIISLLISVYSGRDPKEIAEDDFGFISQIGLKENLSPTRANGLVSMIARIKELAAEMIKVEDTKSNGQEVLTAEDAAELAPLYDNVVLAIKQVYDPEIPVNVYDLGLIYELVINKKHEAYIKMTFTAPTCPMADEVLAEVKKSVADVPGITGCEVELTFEPPWDQSMLSDEARVELGLD